MRKIYLLVITIMAVSLSYSQDVTTNGGSGLNATYPDLNTAITALNGAFIYTPVAPALMVVLFNLTRTFAKATLVPPGAGTFPGIGSKSII